MRVEHKGPLPPSYVATVTDFFANNPPPNGTVALRWIAVAADNPEPSDTSQHQGRVEFQRWRWSPYLKTADDFPSHPRGYRQNPQHPVLRGQNHCRHCLCAPCVIQLPPDFLRGSASPHPANDEKRHRLYRLFWRLLNDMGLWRDDEYLQRKEARTSIYDKREIIPRCVITVCALW